MSGLLGYYEGLLTLINDRLDGHQSTSFAQSDHQTGAAEPAQDESDLAQLIAASVEQVASSASPDELRAMRLDICTQALAEVSRMLRQRA